MSENGTSSLWHWLGKAPIPVLVITFTGFFASWLWSVEAAMGDARSGIAVNSEQITGMKEIARLAEVRLDRMDEKLDKLLVGLAELQLEARRARYSRDWKRDFQSDANDKLINPLTNRENR